VVGLVEGRAVVVGRPQLLQDRSLPLSEELSEAVVRAQQGGSTTVAVGWDGKARGVVVVADAVKERSAEAVARLR